jgi:hypothetical protein
MPRRGVSWQAGSLRGIFTDTPRRQPSLQSADSAPFRPPFGTVGFDPSQPVSFEGGVALPTAQQSFGAVWIDTLRGLLDHFIGEGEQHRRYRQTKAGLPIILRLPLILPV